MRTVRHIILIFRAAVINACLTVLSVLLPAQELRAQYDTDHFFFRGQLALNEGRYLDALNSFNILVRIDPSQYEPYFFRGIAKYNLGDFAGAEADFVIFRVVSGHKTHLRVRWRRGCAPHRGSILRRRGIPFRALHLRTS